MPLIRERNLSVSMLVREQRSTASFANQLSVADKKRCLNTNFTAFASNMLKLASRLVSIRLVIVVPQYKEID